MRKTWISTSAVIECILPFGETGFESVFISSIMSLRLSAHLINQKSLIDESIGLLNAY